MKLRSATSILVLLLFGVLPNCASAQVAPTSSFNVTQVLTRADIEPVLGVPMNDPKIDSNDLSVVRYFPLHGASYLEALVLSVRTFDTIEYLGLIDVAKKAGAFKEEVKSVGDKAFWQENISYGTLTVEKGKLLITITVSLPPVKKEDAAIQLARLALERLHLETPH